MPKNLLSCHVSGMATETHKQQGTGWEGGVRDFCFFPSLNSFSTHAHQSIQAMPPPPAFNSSIAQF